MKQSPLGPVVGNSLQRPAAVPKPHLQQRLDELKRVQRPDGVLTTGPDGRQTFAPKWIGIR